MSRIGKKIIAIPEKTEVKALGNSIVVKGPLGELSREFKPDIKISISENKITLVPTKETLDNSALWGTYASHISNMIKGVEKPFKKKLIIEGIGFKADVGAHELVMNLGFSHQVKVSIPAGLKVTSDKGIITVSGVDKEKVGEFVAKIRAKKKPEPYKGKGIRYIDEIVRRKQGKKTA